MQISPRKIRFGLLVLAVFLGGVLPTLFSLLGDSDVLAVSLPVSAAFGILLFLAQSAPLFFGFVGGYLIMAAAMLSRIPLYAAQPLLITGYEILCFLGFPLILIGLSRLWLRMALSIRLAFLFSALSLLSVFLLMQCGWSFMVDA